MARRIQGLVLSKSALKKRQKKLLRRRRRNQTKGYGPPPTTVGLSPRKACKKANLSLKHQKGT